MGPRYLGFIFLSADISIAEFFTRTRLPGYINVEISAGLGTVKYLSKYIYKGPDRATMEISGGMQNEIKAHLDSCFIGPTEACWKIFEFNMHRESPAVQRLPIHLSQTSFGYISINSSMILTVATAPESP